MSAWFASLTPTPTQRGDQLAPTDHLTCERLRDRGAESATFVNLDGSVGHPGCSAAVLVNLSSAVDRPRRTLDVKQRPPWKGCRR